jgi:hypothetical protein
VATKEEVEDAVDAAEVEAITTPAPEQLPLRNTKAFAAHLATMSSTTVKRQQRIR